MMWAWVVFAVFSSVALAAVIFLGTRRLSALKADNASLRVKEEQNKRMFDAVPIPCFLLDERFTVVHCNAAAVGFFGFADSAEGIERFAQIFSASKGDEMKRYFGEALLNGCTRFEWELVNHSAKPIPVEITFVRCGCGTSDTVAAYINDVSAATNVLNEKENAEAKNRFLTRMSHEIRTPISAVLGIAEIQLQSGNLSSEQELAFDNIYASGNTLLGIVNDILDLSKIEAGKMELVNDEYEVVGLVGDVSRLNRVYRDEKEIEFSIRVDENIPAVLYGDELRIKQILNNFLSNAFKYTEKGTVSFSMYALVSDEKDTDTVNLLITIRDTGRGMTKEQKDALSEEYNRFHMKDVGNADGTGLAMSIAFTLLHMMDAVFEVESEPGRGTTISLLIPQKAVGKKLLGKENALNLRKLNDDARMADMRLQFMPERLPSGRVLVVDDVPANIFIARGLLNLYGLQIDACVSGKECIARIMKKKEYDIIFMDHHMPGMSGMEVTQQLREMGYTKPIVALTANALVGQAEEFMQSGFDGFLSKPISSVRLNEVLDKFIRNANPQGDNPAQANPQTDVLDEFYNRPEVKVEIRTDFVESQRDTIPKLKAALERDDLREALYLVHTLKGLSTLLGESSLTQAAFAIETTIKNGEPPKGSAVALLEKYFTEAYEKISGK